MDSTGTDRDIIKQAINRYAQFVPSHGDIRLDTVFDDEQGRYALMQVGWDRGHRVHGNVIYVAIHGEYVVIEYDGLEQGISQDLVRNGIEPGRIVLAFLSQYSEPI